jgi:hypothetical protein
MTEIPVPLDHLIAYVKSLHPGGGPLENVADAMEVAARLDEQSDALIGYFVDQARRSGASWSQIGASMGVSKQAAQKRFVPRGGEGPEVSFARFTPRARIALAAAGRLATDNQVDAGHLAAGLLVDPDGLAARVIVRAGLTAGQVYAAVGSGPAPDGPQTPGIAEPADADPAALRGLGFTADGEAAMKGALKSALRLGHNYIGTEHLLLGLLYGDTQAGRALVSAGLDADRAEELLFAEFAALKAQRKTG